MSWPKIPVKDLMLKRGGSINPAKFPEETFELLSIPACDKEQPEILKGNEIGSSKCCVQPDDVLLSKIVPHIRRCWIVPSPSGDYRQIGSGEWIIFRSDKIYSPYLKHFLTSDVFHKQFMNTTAGVGGSLMRARPAEVERIEIPLPPLPEQKRIAAILDKADAIRRKRQQAIQLADEFLRSVFLDMFGDPVTNPKKLNTHVLSELVNVVSGATPSKENESFWIGNFPWISPKDMKTVEISESIDHISEKVFELTNLKKLPARSILIVVRGMILAHTVPIGITTTKVSINQDIKAFVCGEKILPEFFLWCLKSQHDYLLSKVSTAAHGTKRFEMEHILSLKVILPDIEQQSNFVRIRNKFINTISATNTSKLASTALCSSISQKAFAGQL